MPDDTLCRALLIPNDAEWLAIVTGAISELTYPHNFESFGSISPEETAERFLTMLNDLNGGCPPMNDLIILQDQKASGNAGGDFNSGSFVTRDLNTEVVDTANRCALASNQFTLQPGRYRIIAQSQAIECEAHQLRIYNVTDSAAVAVGLNAFAYTGAGGPVMSTAQVWGYVVITAEKTYRIEHRCQTSRSFYGRGMNHGWGTEVYTNVWIEVLE